MNLQPHDRAVDVNHVRGVAGTTIPSQITKRRFRRGIPPATADARAMLDQLVNNVPAPRSRVSLPHSATPTPTHPLPRRWLGHGALAVLLLVLIGTSGFPGLMRSLDWPRTSVVAEGGVTDDRNAVPAAAVPHALVLPQAAAAINPTHIDPTAQATDDRQDGLHIFASSRHTVPIPAAVTTPSTTLAGQVIDDQTNLRSGPGTTFDKVLKLNHTDLVKLVGRHDNWFSVQTADGTTGWIEQSLITIAPGVAAQVANAVSVPTTPPLPTTTKVPTEVASTQDAPAVVIQAPAPKPTPAPTPAPILRAARVVSWVWPTYGDITSPFGYRNFAVGSFHNGIDIANSRWTPIVASRSGTVTEAGWCSGYGYCVIMDHGDGFTTEYGHMASSPAVYAGQWVSAGQLIGYMGSTYDLSGGGYSTGVHLHFTIKINGRAVDPLRFLP